MKASIARRIGGRLTLAFALAAVLAAANVTVAHAQELVVTTGVDPVAPAHGRPVLVMPDAGAGWPAPARNFIAPTVVPLNTQGLAFVAQDRVLVSQLRSQNVRLLDTTTLAEIDTLTIPVIGGIMYDGTGTLAVNPARTHVLALTDRTRLWVIGAPFDHTAPVTTVALPGFGATYHARSIAFDATTGRAFVALHNGIVAIDPPYTSVAFTIPVTPLPPDLFGVVPTSPIALSPDGATLVSPDNGKATLRIYHAPFSAASVPDVATIAGATLDSPVFTPDGSKLLIVDLAAAKVYALSPPYSATVTVDTLAFTVTGVTHGFEDIDISSDGQLAALSGEGSHTTDPVVLLRAPFTSAGVTAIGVKIPILADPYDADVGRGDGAARFWPTPIPVPPPQILIDSQTVAEGDSGTKDMVFNVTLSGPSAQTVTVDYTTVAGTATVVDNDYLPVSGTLSFAPGEMAKTIVVQIVGDTFYESNEFFSIALSNPFNGTLLTLKGGKGTITNDDAVVGLAITTPSPLPGATAGTPYTLTFTGTGLHPFTWATGVLPAGLALDEVTGVLSGTPVSGGSFTFDILLTIPTHQTVTKTFALTISGPAVPSVGFPINPVDFGAAPLGVGVLRVAGIVNNGGANLVLGTPFATLPPGSDFTFATVAGNNCDDGTILVPGHGCAIGFTFTPSTSGPRSASVAIASNAAAATLMLKGFGGTGPFITATPNPAAFGDQAVGTTSAAKTLTVTNTGTANVILATPFADFADGTDFALVTGSDACVGGQTLAPTATCNVYVTFTPSVTGSDTDKLFLYSNAAPVMVELSGNGIAAGGPAVTLDTAILNFGNQVVGTTSAAKTVSLTNSGVATLTIASVAASGDFAQTNTCGVALAPAASCTLSVKFTPSILGARTGAVSITDNAPGSPHSVALSGTGVAPDAAAVTLGSMSLSFGNQLVGSISAPQTVSLTNSGGATLTISSIVASGDFSLSHTCGASLAPAATCLISVTFAPSVTGPRSGAVTITDNAPGSPHAVALSGTGTSTAPPPPPPPPSAQIPTLSDAMLAAMAFGLALVAMGSLRRLRRG